MKSMIDGSGKHLPSSCLVGVAIPYQPASPLGGSQEGALVLAKEFRFKWHLRLSLDV